jgi:hypothetical protein
MLSFKQFISEQSFELIENTLVAYDFDKTTGHGDARVRINHSSGKRVISNKEAMKEIGHENLDQSLHKERTSNPNSEFRMTDKEFNENSEKIPHHRYNFDEHISAEGMQNVHWYPKAVGRLKSAVRLAGKGKGIVKPIILTARYDLKSSTPGKTPKEMVDKEFGKQGLPIMPGSAPHLHIVRTGNPEYDIAPGVKGTPHERKLKALNKEIESKKGTDQEYKKLIMADDNENMRKVVEKIAKERGMVGVFYHAVPHPTKPDDVHFNIQKFDGRKNRGTN